jgi:TonB family protein
MYKIATTVALLLIAGQTCVAAPCDLSTTVQSPDLSAEKLAIRGAIYQELCRRSGGTLVDGDAVQPKDTLVLTKKPPAILRRDKDEKQPVQKRTAVLAYTVETTGKVSWVSVLESSGSKEFDSRLFNIVKSFAFDPPTLSGQSVRVFLTIAYRVPE